MRYICIPSNFVSSFSRVLQLDPIPGNGKHGLGKIKEADSSIFVNLPHGSIGVDIGHGKHGVDLFGDKLLSITF